jgi:hypothetical protein
MDLAVLRTACAVVALWIGGDARAASTDLAVVSSTSSSLSKVDVDDVRALYDGEQKYVQGERTHALLLDEGSYDDAFVRIVLGMDRKDYDQHWVKVAYSGAGSAPDAVRSTEAMADRLRSDPSAIGFVPLDALPRTTGLKQLLVLKDAVSGDVQARQIFRTLEHDRALTARAARLTVVETATATCGDPMLASLRKAATPGWAVDSLVFTGSADLGGALAVYLCPGLSPADVTAVVHAARMKYVRTTTGVPGYLDLGVAVAVGRSAGESVPIINLRAANAEGADFDASLLGMAEVRK